MVHNLDVEPKRKKYKRSSTGYKGVIIRPNGTYQMQYGSNGRRKNDGTILQRKIVTGFKTAIQAAHAYDEAAIKAGRKKSTLNFPTRNYQKEKQEKQKEQEKEKKPNKQKKQGKQGKQEKQKSTEMKDLLTMEEYKEMLQASM